MAALDAPAWELLLRQAGAARLGATLALLAEEHGLLAALPGRVQRRLGWERMVWERHAQAVRFEVGQAQRALAGTGLPLILLKGTAYVAAGLPAAAGRLFSDIDILVPKTALGDVESLLMLHGWASGHHDPYDQRYYREWMHELPPMQRMHRATVIDVHHAILPETETAALRPDPARLRAAARAIPGAPGLSVLAPCDMVLHSATHLFYEGEYDHGLRGLFDLHRLLCHFGAAEPGFWTALPARARTRACAAAVLRAALRYGTARHASAGRDRGRCRVGASQRRPAARDGRAVHARAACSPPELRRRPGFLDRRHVVYTRQLVAHAAVDVIEASFQESFFDYWKC